MKVFHVSALVLLFFTTVFMVGCDEGMNMVKPVMMEETESPAEKPQTQEEPATEPVEKPMETTMGGMKDPETQEPAETAEEPIEPTLSEEEAREKAYTIMKPLYPLYVEAREVTGDYEKFDAEFYAATGLDALSLEITLGKIMREEDAAAAEFFRRGTGSSVLIFAEYLRLTFQYPKKSEDEILELFRQAARDGVIIVDREEVKLIFDPPDPIYEEAKRISERLSDIYSELWKQDRENPDPDFLIKVSEAFVEETGIPWFDSGLVFTALKAVYLLKHPEDREYLKVVTSYRGGRMPLVTEFLYVMLTNPEETDKWILLDKHFKEHIQDKDLFDETLVQDGKYIGD